MDTTTFKTLASVPTLLFIGAGSLLNFSFSFITAIFVAPLYALLKPTSYRVLHWIQVVILFTASPVVILPLASLLLQWNLKDLLLTLITQHQLYGNLPYPFLCMAYLPLNLAFVKLFIESNK